MTIHYDLAKKLVRQHIGTISLYDFEGDFKAVINKLKEEEKYYKKVFMDNTRSVCEDSYAGRGAYLDGANTKSVQFDRIYIDLGESYGDREYQVWGERKFLPEEDKALKDKEDKQKEEKENQERVEYEKLKKKFEK